MNETNNQIQFLLDTNFLVIPYQFKVDIYSELRKFGDPDMYTVGPVLQELSKLKNGNEAFRLYMIKGGKVIETGGTIADDEIVKMAKDGAYVVCTQDIKLQERLKEHGVKIVFLRQQRYLEMK